MKYLYHILTISAIALFLSCSGIKKEKILGHYKMDKRVTKDTSVQSVIYQHLYLNENDTFILKNSNSEKIIGRWKILNSTSSDEGTIEFSFDNKTIRTQLKGTILRFEYPNDFYKGKFQLVLYIRSND